MSRAPSRAAGSHRKPGTSEPSASSDLADRHGCRDRRDEVAEPSCRQLPHLRLDRGAAVGHADQARLGRGGVQGEEPVRGSGGGRRDQPAAAVGELVVERLPAQVRPDHGERHRCPRDRSGPHRSGPHRLGALREKLGDTREQAVAERRPHELHPERQPVRLVPPAPPDAAMSRRFAKLVNRPRSAFTPDRVRLDLGEGRMPRRRREQQRVRARERRAGGQAQLVEPGQVCEELVRQRARPPCR